MLTSVQQIVKQLGGFKTLRRAFISFVEANGGTVEQDKTLAQVEFFHAKVIGATTSSTFFTGSTDSAVTNLDSFKRSQSEHMVIYAIRVLEGNDATLAATDWVVAGTGADWVKNGTITLSSNGVKLLDKLPLIGALTSEAAGDEYGCLKLNIPLFWGAQSSIKVDFETSVAGAASDNLQISLIGLALVG